MTNAEAWFNIALRPRKPEGSLGRTAQDGHLDSHTAPEQLILPHESDASFIISFLKRPFSVEAGFVSDASSRVPSGNVC